MGHIQGNLLFIPAGYSMLLTCALTFMKLIHLQYPLVARTWSKNTGHIICIALLGLLMSFYAPLWAVKIFFAREPLYFSYISYVCDSHYRDRIMKLVSWYKVYSPVFMSLFVFLCHTLLVINSVLILLKAKKIRSRTGGGVRLQGIVTVLLTVAVQFLSFLPSCTVYVCWMTMGVDFGGKMWRAASFVIYLNTMANFYIYYFTARSFREFLKQKMTLLKQFIQNNISPARN